MKIEILGTPFNGLGELPDIENPAEGLRQAKLVHLLKAKGHNRTFSCNRRDEPIIR